MFTDILRMDVKLMNTDDGKIRILSPADPDATMSDPPSKSPRDSLMSLDDGKTEVLPPAGLDVTMLPVPLSVSTKESQFQETLMEQPLLNAPKLNINNMFVDFQFHSGADELKSVLCEKETEKSGKKLKPVPGEECFP